MRRRWCAVAVIVAGIVVGCTAKPAPERPQDAGESPPHTISVTVAAPEQPAATATTADVSPAPATGGDPLDATSRTRTPDAGPDAVPTPHPATTGITVTVAAGDTLLGLAMDHDVPMAAIQLQNDLGSTDVLQAGRQLLIPPADKWEGASPFWRLHIVTDGDSLNAIAAAYDLVPEDILAVNDLQEAGLLRIGQALVLPLTTFVGPEAVIDPPTTAPSSPPASATPEGPVVAAAEAPMPPAPTATAVTLSRSAKPPPAIADWPYETVRLMNQVRAEHGLPPLHYNETLARAAQGQADDCAARGTCSHMGSDGSTIKQRVLRAGYAARSWAECWAIRPNPQGAIDIWMDEVPPNDPHRRTLLTDWFTEIGVGVAEAAWGYYFIADFGKPLP